MNIHPELFAVSSELEKWRLAYEGGRDFIDKYLEKMSIRESDADFTLRKNMTYCPRFAGAGIDDIKNSIYQRIADVTRKDGTKSYNDAIATNVDLAGNSMNSFMGCEALPELLMMGSVGIYVDMPPVDNTLMINQPRPYIYIYTRENILNWVKDPDEPTRFKAVILRDYVYEYEDEFPVSIKPRYRKFWREPNGIFVQILDEDEQVVSETLLNLSQIPLINVSLTNSLMVDIADYQIALLNLASSDLFYALKGNFAFYTEQYDPHDPSNWMLKPEGNPDEDNPGSQATVEVAKNREVVVGTTTGRAYPIGAERPQFIAPPSEPLEASMKKQEQLKEEIRQLLNLNIANLRPQRASADSKKIDDRSLEAGLSYIGLTLETAERAIASTWAEYENQKVTVTIHYPKEYSLKTDSERREEAKELDDLRLKIPSPTYQKSVSKQIAHILLSNKISRFDLEKLDGEIDAAPCVTGDPDSIRSDVEAGILDVELATKLRLYPPGTAEKAKADHAERLIRIKNSQASGARGTDTEEQSGKIEKEESRDTTESDNVTTPVRGEAK